MSLDLESLTSILRPRLDLDAKLKDIALLVQVGVTADDSDDAKKYDALYEQALAGAGVVFDAAAAVDGEIAGDTAGQLDLWNHVLFSVCVNRRKYATLSAFQLARRVMRVLHRANLTTRGARHEVMLGSPAYQFAPLSAGTEIYLLSLKVRTTEPLGPVEPV